MAAGPHFLPEYTAKQELKERIPPYRVEFFLRAKLLPHNLARKEGFEPSRRFYPAYSLSRGAPSATWVLPQIHMNLQKVAERVGFEPTETCASPVFKTGSFNHSDISP